MAWACIFPAKIRAGGGGEVEKTDVITVASPMLPEVISGAVPTLRALRYVWGFSIPPRLRRFLIMSALITR